MCKRGAGVVGSYHVERSEHVIASLAAVHDMFQLGLPGDAVSTHRHTCCTHTE